MTMQPLAIIGDDGKKSDAEFWEKILEADTDDPLPTRPAQPHRDEPSVVEEGFEEFKALDLGGHVSDCGLLFELADGVHRGLLVSIPVPAPVAQRLAVPGGEPPASMHVTLCYVGVANDLSPDEIADLRDVVEAVVSRAKPFTFNVVGTDRFSATEYSDNLDVLVAMVESSDLLALRARVYDALTRAGVEPNDSFNYTPHIAVQYIAPEQTVTPVVSEAWNVPVTTVDVLKDGARTSFPLGRQFDIEAAAIDSLKKLPTSSTGPGAPVVVRLTALFKKPMSAARLPLNRKTTANEVTSVLLDDLEPVQEFVPVSGLTKYITKPRRDPADVARLETPNGVRYVVQEGHTRLAAALLRGETVAEVRLWEFVQNAAGGYDPVPRGMHKRGIASLSYREKLVLLTKPRSEYPGGKYPSEEDAQEGSEGKAAEVGALASAMARAGGVRTLSGSSKAERSAAKSKIVGQLKARGLDKEDITDTLDAWAKTSGDHDPTSVTEQRSIAAEFGLEAEQSHFGKTAAGISLGSREYARAEYENTQAWFKEQGITHITVFRGTGGLKIQDGLQEVTMQPASSWSTSIETAIVFAGEAGGKTSTGYTPNTEPVHVLTTRVPVARVLSTAVTGRGCLTESEVVLLGGKITTNAVEMKMTTGPSAYPGQAPMYSWDTQSVRRRVKETLK